MNWSGIGKLAIAVLVVQLAIGFLDGLLSPAGAGVSGFLASAATSFVVCAAVFAIFSARQASKPFTHAWIALLVYVTSGLVFGLILGILGTSPLLFLFLDYAVLVCALMAGVALGSTLKRATGRPAGT